MCFNKSKQNKRTIAAAEDVHLFCGRGRFHPFLPGIITGFCSCSSKQVAAPHQRQRTERSLQTSGPPNHQRVDLKAVSRCGRGLPQRGAQSSAVNQKLLDALSALYAVGTWDYAAKLISLNSQLSHSVTGALGQRAQEWIHTRTQEEETVPLSCQIFSPARGQVLSLVTYDEIHAVTQEMLKPYVPDFCHYPPLFISLCFSPQQCL